MATILLAWELGAGRGHLTRLHWLAQRLRPRGHRVLLAARRMDAVFSVFRAEDLDGLYQAPHSYPARRGQPAPTLAYAQLLESVGYDNSLHLQGLISAWGSLYRDVLPDLIVCDHAPTAQLAARGRFATAILGMGFQQPPAARPWGPMVPELSSDQSATVSASETRLEQTINSALAASGLPVLPALEDIYASAAGAWLDTYPATDHFGTRPDATYVAPLTQSSGAAPNWPAGTGPRVFAYLAGHPQLVDLLAQFGRSGARMLVYCRDGIPAGIAPAGQMALAPGPLDLTAVAADADLVVNNANHGSTVEMAALGLPQLLLPTQQEQAMMSELLRRRGVAAVASYRNPAAAAALLGVMLSQSRYRFAAKGFAAELAALPKARQQAAMVDALDGLANGGGPRL